MDKFLKKTKQKEIKELLSVTGGAEKFKPPPFILAKTVDVYDGDTCTVVCRLTSAGDLCECKVRLLRINTEEIRQPKNKPNRLELKEKALKQKADLESHVLGKLILLETTGFDSFGRILTEVFTLDPVSLEKNKLQIGINVNNWMLKNGTRRYT